MRPLIRVVVLSCLLGGCASYGGRGLAPGASSAEVETLMGPPAEKIALAGGDSVWFYPRQPYGLQTYAATMSADGRLVEMDQRLTVQNVAKLLPGTATREAARALLGPPWRTSRLAISGREAWDYRMYNAVQAEYILTLQFSEDGVLRETLMLEDYKPSGKSRRR